MKNIKMFGINHLQNHSKSIQVETVKMVEYQRLNYEICQGKLIIYIKHLQQYTTPVSTHIRVEMSF